MNKICIWLRHDICVFQFSIYIHTYSFDALNAVQSSCHFAILRSGDMVLWRFIRLSIRSLVGSFGFCPLWFAFNPLADWLMVMRLRVYGWYGVSIALFFFFIFQISRYHKCNVFLCFMQNLHKILICIIFFIKISSISWLSLVCLCLVGVYIYVFVCLHEVLRFYQNQRFINYYVHMYRYVHLPSVVRLNSRQPTAAHITTEPNHIPGPFSIVSSLIRLQLISP